MFLNMDRGYRLPQTTGMQFVVWVPGTPVPKARPRFFRGRTITPPKSHEYERHVWSHVEPHVPADWPMNAEYELHMDLYFKNRVLPDVDNVLKQADALNPGPGRRGCWFDDRQVRKASVERFQCLPGDEGMRLTVVAVDAPKAANYVERPIRKPARKPRRKKSRVRG